MVGPMIGGGGVSKHPSRSNLAAGDSRFDTDFRQDDATLLDGWLGRDGEAAPGANKDHARTLEFKA